MCGGMIDRQFDARSPRFLYFTVGPQREPGCGAVGSARRLGR